MQAKEIRLANLRHLIKREGAVSQLALRLQISPIYIYRVLDGKFNIGDSMARKIEDAYGFPAGWMESNHEGEDFASLDIPTLTPDQRISNLDLDQYRGEQPTTNGPPSPQPVATGPGIPSSEQPTASVPGAQIPGSSPSSQRAGPSDAGRSEDINERLIIGVINTLERMLIANGVELSDTEKARLLMKTAERLLDFKGDEVSEKNPLPKTALKIS